MNSTTKLTCKEVYERVLQDWRDKLNDGHSWPKKELIEATSADLCEAYLANSNCSAYGDLVNPHEPAWASFEKEVLPKLLADDRYEVERGNGQEKIRCCEPTVGEGAAPPSPETTPAPSVTGVDDQPAPDWNAECFHDLAKLFPALADDQFQALKEDIRQNGQHYPILLVEGKVVDGRGRYRACRELGIEPKTIEWDKKGSLVAQVKSLNLHRRHLSESQASMVAANMIPLLEEEAKQRMRVGKAADPGANLHQGRSCELAGKEMGISARTVAAAKKVLATGTPELIEAVEKGDLKVSAAEKLAKLPPKQQRAVLAKRKQPLNKKARRPRAKNKPTPPPRLAGGDQPSEQLVLASAKPPMEAAAELVKFYGPSRATTIRDCLDQLLTAEGKQTRQRSTLRSAAAPGQMTATSDG